jgi:glycosyltransferase involved in cell wall biosynthesis
MPGIPLVTVGIANYNYARFVTQALDSVASQTYENCELIIVDDCSNDHSVEVIQTWINNYTGNFKITFIKNNENYGVAKVCSSILERTSGKYYQILDADDAILPTKIAKQVSILEKDENSALVYSNTSVIDERNEIEDDYLQRIGYNTTEMPEGNIFNELLIFNFIPNSSVLIRTAFAKQIGGYNPTFQVQDYYLYLTLSEHFPFSYSNCISGFYRVHSNSLSNTFETNRKSIEGTLQLQIINYSKGNQKAKESVRKSIFNMAPYFYKHNFSTTFYWLKKNVQLNPGFRSFGYFVAFNLRIPFSFFDQLKSMFLKKI